MHLRVFRGRAQKMETQVEQPGSSRRSRPKVVLENRRGRGRRSQIAGTVRLSQLRRRLLLSRTATQGSGLLGLRVQPPTASRTQDSRHRSRTNARRTRSPAAGRFKPQWANATKLVPTMTKICSRESEIDEYGPPMGTGKYSSTIGLRTTAVKIPISACARVIELRRVAAAVRSKAASKNMR